MSNFFAGVTISFSVGTYGGQSVPLPNTIPHHPLPSAVEARRTNVAKAGVTKGKREGCSQHLFQSILPQTIINHNIKLTCLWGFEIQSLLCCQDP